MLKKTKIKIFLSLFSFLFFFFCFLIIFKSSEALTLLRDYSWRFEDSKNYFFNPEKIKIENQQALSQKEPSLNSPTFLLTPNAYLENILSFKNFSVKASRTQDLGFQLSGDQGQTWLYFNGSNWINAEDSTGLNQNYETENFTISVCQSGCDFTSIQEAINKAPVKSVIEVKDSASYNENIYISKNNLTLQAQKGETPKLDGNNLKNGTALYLDGADNITIKGFEILNYPNTPSLAVIFLENGCQNINLEKNLIHDNKSKAIFAQWSVEKHQNINIVNNKIFNHPFNTAIYLRRLDQGLISHNEIYNNKQGVFLYSEVNAVTIENNIVRDQNSPVNGEGVKIDNNSDQILVHHNLIYDNQDRGINLDDDSDEVIIDHNVIFNNSGSGIFIKDDSANTQIKNNIIYRNHEFGIEVKNVSENLLPSSFHNNLFENVKSDYNELSLFQITEDLHEDPLFLKTAIAPDNFHLHPNSPSLNAAGDESDQGAYSNQDQKLNSLEEVQKGIPSFPSISKNLQAKIFFLASNTQLKEIKVEYEILSPAEKSSEETKALSSADSLSKNNYQRILLIILFHLIALGLIITLILYLRHCHSSKNLGKTSS
jgi:parallel beta-helix repeat protein